MGLFLPRYEDDFLRSLRSELTFIPEDAAPRDLAKQVGRRDNWTCQDTGKRFQDGNLMDIAHYDHDRSKPYYNTPHNLRTLWRNAHLEEHIRWFLSSGNHRKPVELLAQRNWGYIDRFERIQEGLHSYIIYQRSPEILQFDRRLVVGVFEKYSLDPRDFFILDNENHLPGKWPGASLDTGIEFV